MSGEYLKHPVDVHISFSCTLCPKCGRGMRPQGICSHCGWHGTQSNGTISVPSFEEDIQFYRDKETKEII